MTFVRRTDSGEKVDSGAGLTLRARFLDRRLETQSSLAWVNSQDGHKTEFGFAQRYKISARLFELPRQNLKLKAIARYERVEPGYAGAAAKRTADRQGTEFETQVEVDALRVKVSRRTKFDNIVGQDSETNRWDSWKLGGTVDLARLGVAGVKVGVTWRRGKEHLDDGAGFSQQEKSEELKLKLKLGKNTTTEFANRRVLHLDPENDSQTDTTNALSLKWNRLWGSISTTNSVKFSYVDRESESDDVVNISLGFEAKSGSEDNLKLKLGAEMEHRSNERDAYRFRSSMRVLF